ncbi:MAG TPA: dihydrofolate reductase family protein, partial [Fimbriimonadaceae bacterium]|nr:dihydrofolate reductase family protein [Fimbriimonadaceae bacterium]
VAGPAASSFVESGGVRRLVAGKEEFDPKAAFGELRRLGCRLLLALGGSRMNGSLFAAGLVDEIFLTMAPAIKLGEGLPTVAEGRPFPRGALPVFEIVEHHAVGNEIFLRYRRFAER